MPEMYEKIRDKAVASGMPYDAAQTKAAKIYNSIRKKHPNMPKLDSGYHAKKIKKS